MLIVISILIAIVDTTVVAMRADEYGLLGALARYEHSFQRAIEVSILGESTRPKTWLHYNRIISILAILSNLSTNIVTYYADLLCLCSALAFYLVVKMTLEISCSPTEVYTCGAVFYANCLLPVGDNFGIAIYNPRGGSYCAVYASCPTP